MWKQNMDFILLHNRSTEIISIFPVISVYVVEDTAAFQAQEHQKPLISDASRIFCSINPSTESERTSLGDLKTKELIVKQGN